MRARVEPEPAIARSVSARTRFLVCLALGVVVAVTLSASTSLRYSMLLGLMTLAAAYVLWTWLALRGLDAEETRRQARREDAGWAVSDIAILVVVAASIGAVGVLLGAGRSSAKVPDAALAVGSVLLSWFLLHTMYVGRYARLYYSDDRTPGGIDFNSPDPPTYREFTYFSFNLGMTYQVSDTSVSDRDIRRAVLRHCLMSYFFGTTILACTINLVVNLAS